MGTKDLQEQRDALLTDLAAAYAREDALKRERDAAIAERDALLAARDAVADTVVGLAADVVGLTTERDALRVAVAALQTTEPKVER